MPVTNAIMFDGSTLFDPAIFDTSNHYVETPNIEIVSVSDQVNNGYFLTINESEQALFDFNIFDPAIFDTSTHGPTVSDSVLTARLRTITETAISVSDSLTEITSFIRSLSETISVSDVTSRLGTFFRTVGEVGSVMFDSSIFDSAIFDTTIYSIQVSDSLTKSSSFFRTITESAISVGDVLSRIYTAIRNIPETTLVSDSLSFVNSFFRTLSESVVVSESLTTMNSFFRTISESVISVGDSIVRSITIARTISESLIGVNDRISAFIPPLRLFLQSRLLRKLDGWQSRIKRVAP